MAEGFLNRWSRRKAGKLEELSGEVNDPVKPAKDLPVETQPVPSEASPPATMEDVEKIDRFAPDFSAFMKPEVDPTVQQAALKKMFTDPHFNVMDGLDIYIDDYSKPDPLPPGMLEKLVQSDMLGLFQKTAEAADPALNQSKSAIDSEAKDAGSAQALGNVDQSALTSSQPGAINESADLDKKSVDSNKKNT